MFPQQRAKTINTPSHISFPLAPNHIKIWAHPFITHPWECPWEERSQIPLLSFVCYAVRSQNELKVTCQY